MNSNDFVSTDEVVAEAAEYLEDTDFTHGVGKSFYELVVHRTIESLALNMFFSTVTKDIFNWNKYGNNIIEIPKNCFNIKQIYLFNSSCDKRRCKDESASEQSDTNSYQATTFYKGFLFIGLRVDGVDYEINYTVNIESPSNLAGLIAALDALNLGVTFTAVPTGDKDDMILSVSCTDKLFEKIVTSIGDGEEATNFVQFSCATPVPEETFEADECCRNRTCWHQYVEAHWKRQFNKFGSTGVKTAKIAPDHFDPVYQRPTGYNSMDFWPGTIGRLIYFGVQGGDIAFSDNAECYKNMRIVCNGFGSDNCELPIIPRPLRAVCVDKTKLDVCKKIMVTDDRYKAMYPVYKSDLFGDSSIQNPGTWLQAERYVKSLNSKQRDDLFEYFGNITIK